jgi:hypothetical protein
MVASEPEQAGGRCCNLNHAAAGHIGNHPPSIATHSVMTINTGAARQADADQPDWKSAWRAGLSTSNTHHIMAKVARPNTELTVPKHSLKRPMACGRHASGARTRSVSARSNGMPAWAVS